MTDTYTIYLVNNSADIQTFWCFLAPPQQLVNDPGVFANSSASLAVRPNSQGQNYFAIPVQYVVGAGASNQAVGLNVQVVSNVTNNASLQDQWSAQYATVPPNMGPTMSRLGTSGPANTISIASNAFNKSENENASWFSNQSFGIQTQSGFIGMTWSPNPQQTRTLTPKLTFYVSVGDYGQNSLASWNDVSNNAATISVPNDFQYNKCTVTYTATGGWTVTQGPPPASALAADLGWLLSEDHLELAALTYLSLGDTQADTLSTVAWDSADIFTADGNTYLSGSLTVTTALKAAFGYFILSGVRFQVDRSEAGGTTVHFSYSGTRSAQAVQDLFRAGVQLLFGKSE